MSRKADEKMDFEKEIDALFQGPLADFVAARNALAKRAGARSAEVRALQKPNVPAWAVNQLYWRKRRVFDRLVAASKDVRSAYAAQFAGRSADVQKADAAHREAQRAAMDEIHAILKEAGESETQATLAAVRETLAVLPADAAPGRLSKPLKPQGFEALLGITALARQRKLHVVQPAAAPPPRAAIGGDRDKAADEARAAREAAESRRRERLAVEQELREAQKGERRATDALTRTRAAIDIANRERKRLQQELTDLVDRSQALSKQATAEEGERQAAVRLRQSLEHQLAGLKQT